MIKTSFHIKIFCLVFILITAFGISHADSIRIIKLKDGSVLKGRVLKLEQGIYAIQTPQLGVVQIPESDVLSIQQNALPQSKTLNTKHISSNELKSQVDSMQATILNNPAMMNQIEALLQNPEILNLISDSNLLNSIMSYDMNTIENDSNVQKLMQNPEIQQMLQSIQSQLETPQQNP